MIGWKVKIKYAKNGFAVQETKFINFESADVEINSIKERVNQLLEETEGVSVYIEDCNVYKHALKVNFSGDKAHIFDLQEAILDSYVSAEDAKGILQAKYLKMMKKAKEMCGIGMGVA